MAARSFTLFCLECKPPVWVVPVRAQVDRGELAGAQYIVLNEAAPVVRRSVLDIGLDSGLGQELELPEAINAVQLG